MENTSQYKTFKVYLEMEFKEKDISDVEHYLRFKKLDTCVKRIVEVSK